MKDSGVEWIGEIPKDWKIGKIKSEFQNLDGKRKPVDSEKRNHNSDVLYDYYGASGIIDKIDDYIFDEPLILIGEDGANLVMRNLPLIYIAKGKYWVNNHAHVLKPINNNDLRFMAYQLETIDLVPYITGSTQPKLSQRNLNSIALIIPSIKEQKEIADFLDKRVSQIDNITNQTTLSIEEYKKYKQNLITEAVTKGLNPNVEMKDSGIEWIGEIPINWRYAKLKRLLEIPITDGPHETPELLDKGIPFISAEAIKNNKINFNLKRGYISLEEHERFCKKCKPQLNDIFMIKSGATTGNIAIVETTEVFSIWSPLALFRCNKTILFYEFLFHYMQSYGFRQQVEQFWNYGTQQNIGMGVLGNLFISLPSMEEQKQIADYLDKKCLEIDSLIAQKELLLKELKSYKKSLIYEYVTGKREVN